MDRDSRPKLLGTASKLGPVTSLYRYLDSVLEARSSCGYAAESICNSPRKLAANLGSFGFALPNQQL